MARAAVVLAFAVCCCLLVAPAPGRLTVDLPRPLPDAVDREAAAEKLIPLTAVVQVPDAEAADQEAPVIGVPEEEGTAIAVQQEEERPPRPQRSSLLCLVFRCGGGAEPAGADGKVAVARDSSSHAQHGWAQPAAAGTEAEEEVHDGKEHGAYDSDSDWDSDCDSDDEDEGGIMGWFWRLADAF
ncbi:hypothetical protein QOZ80_1AG0001580 [Eleusine coracana subsp. coracana]|nr:hypothetical protein QOZ80_1AG0001580 [Eleusine coracana subsp. coracana]